MEKLFVKAESESYPIIINNGFDLLKDEIEKNIKKRSSLLIVTDTNVNGLYTETVKAEVNTLFDNIFVYVFKAGEKSKNLDTIRDMYAFMQKSRMDRSGTVLALGGGVCGDMAGFAAATFMRGISFVQVPTTLLAQVDSSVGGKVGVDFNGAKNVIGAFYQPKLVYINTKTLDTLPEREFSAGMAEVIKYGPIYSEKFYDYIINNKSEILSRETGAITEAIKTCCSIKAEVVGQDEHDNGLREILNYGHTIGHAVESLKEFELIHGECVAIGMAAAMKISVDKGMASLENLESLKSILKFFKLPVTVRGLETERIYETLFSDKKVRNNTIAFVLTEGIGKSIRTKTLTESEIKSGIEYIAD